MTHGNGDTSDEPASSAPSRDAGMPDPVDRDPAALNSAEDLDEDRLRLDPLEAGMDPPERWSAADKYGMTPYEQAHPRPLDERLAEEEPDVTAARPPYEADDLGSPPELIPATGESEVMTEAINRGQAADEAGGSYAITQRTPEPNQDPT